MSTLTYTGTLQITHCGVCQVPHAIPAEMYQDRLDNGGNWWCPNGHKLHFITTQKDKLEERLARAKRDQRWYEDQLAHTRDQRDAANRSAAAYRGHLTRMRNKIANGVCPVAGCRRHFDNVQAHIKTVHTDWVAEHPEALS